jgi:hypothetical protein
LAPRADVFLRSASALGRQVESTVEKRADHVRTRRRPALARLDEPAALVHRDELIGSEQ